MFEDVFNGLGKPPIEQRMRVKDDADPLVRPAHRFPFKMNKTVFTKLNELEEASLTAKVNESTDWVNPTVVEKIEWRRQALS